MLKSQTILNYYNSYNFFMNLYYLLLSIQNIKIYFNNIMLQKNYILFYL